MKAPGIVRKLDRRRFLRGVGVTLALALVLTIYSMLDYLWTYRALIREKL